MSKVVKNLNRLSIDRCLGNDRAISSSQNLREITVSLNAIVQNMASNSFAGGLDALDLCSKLLSDSDFLKSNVYNNGMKLIIYVTSHCQKFSTTAQLLRYIKYIASFYGKIDSLDDLSEKLILYYQQLISSLLHKESKESSLSGFEFLEFIGFIYDQKVLELLPVACKSSPQLVQILQFILDHCHLRFFKILPDHSGCLVLQDILRKFCNFMDFSNNIISPKNIISAQNHSIVEVLKRQNNAMAQELLARSFEMTLMVCSCPTDTLDFQFLIEPLGSTLTVLWKMKGCPTMDPNIIKTISALLCSIFEKAFGQNHSFFSQNLVLLLKKNDGVAPDDAIEAFRTGLISSSSLLEIEHLILVFLKSFVVIWNQYQSQQSSLSQIMCYMRLLSLLLHKRSLLEDQEESSSICGDIGVYFVQVLCFLPRQDLIDYDDSLLHILENVVLFCRKTQSVDSMVTSLKFILNIVGQKKHFSNEFLSGFISIASQLSSSTLLSLKGEYVSVVLSSYVFITKSAVVHKNSFDSSVVKKLVDILESIYVHRFHLQSDYFPYYSKLLSNIVRIIENEISLQNHALSNSIDIFRLNTASHEFSRHFLCCFLTDCISRQSNLKDSPCLVAFLETIQSYGHLDDNLCEILLDYLLQSSDNIIDNLELRINEINSRYQVQDNHRQYFPCKCILMIMSCQWSLKLENTSKEFCNSSNYCNQLLQLLSEWIAHLRVISKHWEDSKSSSGEELLQRITSHYFLAWSMEYLFYLLGCLGRHVDQILLVRGIVELVQELPPFLRPFSKGVIDVVGEIVLKFLFTILTFGTDFRHVSSDQESLLDNNASLETIHELLLNASHYLSSLEIDAIRDISNGFFLGDKQYSNLHEAFERLKTWFSTLSSTRELHFIVQLTDRSSLKTVVGSCISKMIMVYSANVIDSHQILSTSLTYLPTRDGKYGNVSYIPIMLEIYLQLAEICDHCGHVDLSLNFLSKARGLVHSNICWRGMQRHSALRSVRILMRCNSRKINECLEDIESGICIEGDVLSCACRAAGKAISNQYWDVLSSTWFLYLGRYWCPFGNLGESPYWFSSRFQCCIGQSNEEYLGRNLVAPVAIPSVIAIRSQYLYFDDAALWEKIAAKCYNLPDSFLNFDVIRSLRRGLAFEMLLKESSVDIDDTLLGFVSSMASIQCSLECSRFLEGSCDSNDILLKLHNALNGCSMSLHQIALEIRDVCQLKIGGMESSSIVGMIFCQQSSSLLLSRCDSLGPCLVCLPVSVVDKEWILRWDELMKSNKEILKQSRDVETIQSWTSRDKQKWWDSRHACNEGIENYLEKWDIFLGPWTWFLFGTFAPLKFIDISYFFHLVQDTLLCSFLQESVIDFTPETCMQSTLFAVCCRFLSLYLGSNHLGCNLSIIHSLMHSFFGGRAFRLSIAIEEIIATFLEICQRFENRPCSNKEEVEGLSVAILKEELRKYNQSIHGKKGELVERLKCCVSTLKEASPSSCHSFLILDEFLQGIPFECLVSGSGFSCSRFPSFGLLLEGCRRLRKVNEGSIVRQSCWYVINPERNLPATEKVVMDYLIPLATSWSWNGYVGQFPEDSIARKFHECYQLLIYCGHGAGDPLLQHLVNHSSLLGSMKKPLLASSSSSSTTTPSSWSSSSPPPSSSSSSLLWGCSSGRLIAQGIHEPRGAALTYLRGGAIFVLGNLWDVTDRDLDKLCIECMTNFFEFDIDVGNRSREPINICLKNSRKACKLKYAVGSSPVVYGIPMSMQQ